MLRGRRRQHQHRIHHAFRDRPPRGSDPGCDLSDIPAGLRHRRLSDHLPPHHAPRKPRRSPPQARIPAYGKRAEDRPCEGVAFVHVLAAGSVVRIHLHMLAYGAGSLVISPWSDCRSRCGVCAFQKEVLPSARGVS